MPTSSAFAHNNPDTPSPGHLSDRDFAQVIRHAPLVAIDLILRRADGRALLGRRNFEPAKGTFFVVGGRIKKGETLAAAFRRISEKEMGLARGLEDARFKGVYEHFYEANFFEKPGFGTHYIVLAYELRLSGYPEPPTDQHGEYVWWTEAEILNSPEVHENAKAYFRKSQWPPASPAPRPRRR